MTPRKPTPKESWRPIALAGIAVLFLMIALSIVAVYLVVIMLGGEKPSGFILQYIVSALTGFTSAPNN